MAIQVIIAQSGPLPITATFNAPGDEPMILEVNGSVWSQTPNAMLGIAVVLDGKEISEPQIFSNGVATHRTVVPGYVQVQLSEGQHTLTLSVDGSGNTISDANDLYTAVLHY